MTRLLPTLACLFALVLSGCGGGGSDDPLPATTPDSTTPTETPDNGTPIVSVDEDGYTTVGARDLASQLELYPLGELSDEEAAGLAFMREEEKLAGDVYSALFDVHGLRIFANIADSEQTHAEAVLALLDRYDLPDPATGEAGVFTNTDLQMLYDTLVARGSASLYDGLVVGALIEDLDIVDLDDNMAQVVENDDILLVYNNLQLGSRNHLRAFYRQLTANGWDYTPEYLSQEAFDEIVNSEMERPAD